MNEIMYNSCKTFENTIFHCKAYPAASVLAKLKVKVGKYK